MRCGHPSLPPLSLSVFSCLTLINNEFEWISRFVIIAYATTLNIKGNLHYQTKNPCTMVSYIETDGYMVSCFYVFMAMVFDSLLMACEDILDCSYHVPVGSKYVVHA
jgi:hypothetical protein